MSSSERRCGCGSGGPDGSESGCGCGGVGCGAIVLERNRYFTGKYMTPRDFAADQEYFLSHHRLHNRLLHGWGIVCGLDVEPHPNPDCADRWVVVRAGIAIDCCGRELVLPKDTAFELPLPEPPAAAAPAAEAAPAAAGQPAGGVENDDDDSDDEPQVEPFLICLVYRERRIEVVPALYSESACDPQRHEANRVRELGCLEVRRYTPDCWGRPDPGDDHECCDEPLTLGCLEPSCPCGECVPLALIEFDPDDPAAGHEIDLGGRRYLPPPAEYLTHIRSTSWQHGGEVSIDHLRHHGGRLVVGFDRPLMPSDGDATGINEYTFVVQYGGIEENLEFITSERAPSLGDDDCHAVFVIDERFLARGPRHNSIVDMTVYVTLKCDFILDCHGNPVSGAHLRGRLPSGDGRPGGTFESWFRVVPGRHSGEEY